MPLPGDPADPDVCGHLWPVLDPGAVEAFGDGLAPVEVDVADEVCDRAGVALVEALAMFSPNAMVAPSTAAPAAVPMSGLLILTRFSFRSYSARQLPGAGRMTLCSAQVVGAAAGLVRCLAAMAGAGGRCPAQLVAGAGGVIPWSAGRCPGRAGWPAGSQ